jgi:hypothetical protein
VVPVCSTQESNLSSLRPAEAMIPTPSLPWVKNIGHNFLLVHVHWLPNPKAEFPCPGSFLPSTLTIIPFPFPSQPPHSVSPPPSPLPPLPTYLPPPPPPPSFYGAEAGRWFLRSLSYLGGVFFKLLPCLFAAVLPNANGMPCNANGMPCNSLARPRQVLPSLSLSLSLPFFR